MMNKISLDNQENMLYNEPIKRKIGSFLKGKTMLVVNNVEQLKKVMVFEPQKSYYKFVCMVRTKDYKDGEEPVLTNSEKQEILVRQWLVDSEEQLDKLLPDMLKLTELLKCRLYMCTDRKSTVKTMVQARNQLQDYLDMYLCNPNPQMSVRALNKVMKSATSKSESSDKERRWMFDVDTKNDDVLYLVKKMCGEHFLATFKTKNGYHVVANKKFDANSSLQMLKKSFKAFDKVEVKDNAMTLVAMGG